MAEAGAVRRRSSRQQQQYRGHSHHPHAAAAAGSSAAGGGAAADIGSSSCSPFTITFDEADGNPSRLLDLLDSFGVALVKGVCSRECAEAWTAGVQKFISSLGPSCDFDDPAAVYNPSVWPNAAYNDGPVLAGASICCCGVRDFTRLEKQKASDQKRAFPDADDRLFCFRCAIPPSPRLSP